ncbi:MAG: hypothetical protein HY319_15005 [Armatimonadetes bacterium]|nr:hypothetical protein [Armatimonadota bacterium]
MIRPSGNSQALAAVDAALAALSSVRTHNDEADRAGQEALAALDGYEPHVRTIEFDRPDRDVSAEGRALRSKSEGSAALSEEGAVHGLETAHDVSQVGESVDRALAAVDSNHWRARQALQQAAAEVGFLNRYSLPGLTEGFALSQETLGAGLSPYLTEVEEDAPGRDVGRFADKIGGRFELGADQIRHSQVSVLLVEDGSDKLQEYLDTARADLAR